MRTNIKHFAVNWVDGMKLAQSHFSSNDLHFRDIIRDASSTSLNSYNYGLMPPLEKMQESLSVKSSGQSSSHFELELESCNGVTANGTRIIYTPELYGESNPRLSVSASEMDELSNAYYYVLININPFKNIPIGTPDPEEIPLRHPNSYPEVSLQLMPRNKTNSHFIGTFQFVIGELNWENGNFIWDDSYIPPCTTMESHEQLKKFLKATVQRLEELKRCCITIIRSNSFGNPVNNKLAKNTCGICTEILDFIALNIFEFKQVLIGKPPIEFVNKISMLANKINTFLIQTPDKEKEELLQYYHEWENVRPVDFESVLGELMDLNYEHTNIPNSLESIQNFLNTLLLLWQKLSQLEYVGQRKNNIVIREEVQQSNKKIEKRWSLLD